MESTFCMNYVIVRMSKEFLMVLRLTRDIFSQKIIFEVLRHQKYQGKLLLNKTYRMSEGVKSPPRPLSC